MRTTSTISSTLALSSMATVALAQSWNFATYRVADNQKITSYTGSMVAPPLPKAGTYYLWPGLQPADNSGIFQPVLDGRSGSWWFGMGWCCSNPSLPWGGGFGVDAGTVLGFNWTLSDSESTWKTTISNGKTGEMVDGEFPLGKLQSSRTTKKDTSLTVLRLAISQRTSGSTKPFLLSSATGSNGISVRSNSRISRS